MIQIENIFIYDVRSKVIQRKFNLIKKTWEGNYVYKNTLICFVNDEFVFKTNLMNYYLLYENWPNFKSTITNYFETEIRKMLMNINF